MCCSYCIVYCISSVFPTCTRCSVMEYVCECGVTECLNYGLIVSLAGFCCWHHIGPVKVNYWNMFICCQPLPQAVTCTETQANTHRRCSLKQFTGNLLPLNIFPHLFCFCFGRLCTVFSQPPEIQTPGYTAGSLRPDEPEVTACEPC